MLRALRIFCSCLLVLVLLAPLAAQTPRFRVLAFHSAQGERDHLDFDLEAVGYFRALALKDGFAFRDTTNWNEMTPETLAGYQVVLWFNAGPSTPAQRQAFEQYMEHGGAWMGFHGAGWMENRATWPWFADFLGTLFNGNSWPPLPGTLRADHPQHPALAGLPAQFESPANEWYSWAPSPRTVPGVQVLLTLDAANYPIGFKDTLTGGDVPVCWTNTRYHMLYTNMGHGARIFDSPKQNRFFENALLWLGEGK
jgi:type 1 glutamine amidotransferase